MRLLAILFICLTHPVFAEPQKFDLLREKSEILFLFRVGTSSITGRFPSYAAKLLLDFDDVQNSKISLSIHAPSVATGIVLATKALRSKSVLSVREFPTILFNSNSVSQTGERVTMRGDLTLHGVTHPVTFNVSLLEKHGDRMRLMISGAVNRHDFGISSYPKLVEDRVQINFGIELVPG